MNTNQDSKHMTQEDKELVLIDLSARLPYRVMVHIRYNTEEPCYGELTPKDIQWFIDSKIKEIKPYLRPMSSMTEEEKHYIRHHFCPEYYFDVDLQGNISDNDGSYIYEIELSKMAGYIDYLNKHHFDYRGLIEKGLAIAVTKDNNPYES